MPEQNFPQVEPTSKSNAMFYILIVVAVIIAIVAIVFFLSAKPKAVPTSGSTTDTPVVTESNPEPQGLGAEISEQLQNPLGNALPDTAATAGTVNPLQGVYENPFGQ